MDHWILPLHTVSLADAGRVGGKDANLGHLLRAGFPVPDGFCITTNAYDAVVAAGGVGPVIEEAVAGLTDHS